MQWNYKKSPLGKSVKIVWEQQLIFVLCRQIPQITISS